MEGCLPNLVKYLLFFTNLLVFILGIVTLGFGIWVVVDKPSFLNLFDDAQQILNENDINTEGFDISVYASAPVVLIVVAVIVALIAFFGCFGAIKENKCMLITYFIIILCIFIAFIVGAVLVYQGKFESEIKDPLRDSIKYYKDKEGTALDESVKGAWNTVQAEFKCCGVDNATDWKTATAPNWEVGNKPAGCCMYDRKHDDALSEEQQKVCRNADYNMKDTYYFEGCYTVIVDSIKSHQDKIFGAAIGTVVVMFMNMLFAFALCTMAE